MNSAESHPIKHTPGHCRTFANPCPARDSPGRTYAIRVMQRTGAKTTHLSGGETIDPREDIQRKKGKLRLHTCSKSGQEPYEIAKNGSKTIKTPPKMTKTNDLGPIVGSNQGLRPEGLSP